MWQAIVDFNDKYFPDWRDRELLLYSNALAGEAGELCNVVTKMFGGGTNVERQWAKGKLTYNARIEVVDVFIQLVLFLASQGLDADHFETYFNIKMSILEDRMEAETTLKEKRESLASQ